MSRGDFFSKVWKAINRPLGVTRSVPAIVDNTRLFDMALLLKTIEIRINHSCELTAFADGIGLHIRIVFTPKSGNRVPHFYEHVFSMGQLGDTMNDEVLIREFLDRANNFIRQQYPPTKASKENNE